MSAEEGASRIDDAPEVEVRDLSAEPVEASEPPEVRPFDPGPTRERVRGWLAGGLSVLLAVIVLGSGVTVAVNPKRLTVMVELLKLVFAPVVGLVGSVLGFYFGAQAASTRESRAP